MFKIDAAATFERLYERNPAAVFERQFRYLRHAAGMNSRSIG